MMPRASCRCAKLWRAPGCGEGNTSEKVSLTMPQTAGTCVTLEIHFGRSPSRMNSTSVVRPYSTQDSPCPCTSGSTMTRPRWVTSIGSPSSSTSITDSALKAIGCPVASSQISVTMARDSRSRSPEKMP